MTLTNVINYGIVLEEEIIENQRHQEVVIYLIKNGRNNIIDKNDSFYHMTPKKKYLGLMPINQKYIHFYLLNISYFYGLCGTG